MLAERNPESRKVDRKLRLAFVADGRADHAQRWIRYFAEIGDDVLVLSTQPCDWKIPQSRCVVLPGRFRPGNAFVSGSQEGPRGDQGWVAWLLRHGVDRYIRPLWQRLTVLDVPPQARAAHRVLDAFRPDLVHALRVTNEALVAARSGWQPWMASVWGSDFIYTCRHHRIQRWWVQKVLPHASGLTADCQRDIEIARRYGFPSTRPSAVFPGNGGIRFEQTSIGLEAKHRPPTILFARGFGPWLRGDTLLRAFADVCRMHSAARLQWVVNLAQVQSLQRQFKKFGVPADRVDCLPFMPVANWLEMLQTASIYVSPSTSDGVPNGLLESMACGAFPVMGDLASIREWVRHGENGLLFDPRSAGDLRQCLLKALADAELREGARLQNRALVEARADYWKIMPSVRAFYLRLVQSHASA